MNSCKITVLNAAWCSRCDDLYIGEVVTAHEQLNSGVFVTDNNSGNVAD